jgi:hypothetical protein
MTTTAAARAKPSPWRTIGRRWPAALGLGVAVVQLAAGVDRDEVSTVLFVATLCYLGAAAVERRWVAWFGIPAGLLVAEASELAGWRWWVGVAAFVPVLVVAALITRAPRGVVVAQVIAAAGYGFLAVLALDLGSRVGLALAGAALAGHAVWDVIHYRHNRVVSRSLAEFCMLLDVPLGVGAIVFAVVG